MKYTATLNIFNNLKDPYNKAFLFIDHETGNRVGAVISGGVSNLKAITRHWNVPNDWDRSILINEIDLKAKEYKHTTQGWEYAGCQPEEIADFIRKELSKDQ